MLKSKREKKKTKEKMGNPLGEKWNFLPKFSCGLSWLVVCVQEIVKSLGSNKKRGTDYQEERKEHME